MYFDNKFTMLKNNVGYNIINRNNFELLKFEFSYLSRCYFIERKSTHTPLKYIKVNTQIPVSASLIFFPFIIFAINPFSSFIKEEIVFFCCLTHSYQSLSGLFWGFIFLCSKYITITKQWTKMFILMHSILSCI